MDHNLCVLIDFDNIAKGSRQEGLGEFDIRLVMRRLKDIGRVLVARAYCDWERWPRHRTALAEQGVTMVELVATGHGDKNRGDIALAVDAMEIAFSRDFLDTFVILSGDSDFTPLVQRLKELNRSVIGIGTRGSTSRLIANVCDEFIFYDTLHRQKAAHQQVADDEERASSGNAPSKLKLDVAFNLLVETLENHARDEAGPVHASIVKTSMKRKLSTFSETELGFRTFARFMERAQAEGLVALSRDEKAGGYRVELAPGPSDGPSHSTSAPPAPPPVQVAPEPPTRRRPEPVLNEAARAALEALRAEGLDIATAEERKEVLLAFGAACAERTANGRRLAVQYLQGDLVQQGLDPDVVRGVLHALGRSGALLHADGEPVRGPTSPMQPPASPLELNLLLEERALELLGRRRLKLDADSKDVLFAHIEAPPDSSADFDDDEPSAANDEVVAPAPEAAPEAEPVKPARRPRTRRPRRDEADAAPVEADSSAAPAPEADAPEAGGEDAGDGAPRRRGRRGGNRGR